MTEEGKLLIVIGGILMHPQQNPTEKLKRIQAVFHKWAYKEEVDKQCQTIKNASEESSNA